ncbi:MAG: CBS domain-containing protein, partial [Synergistales bacterium]|nr:CBS domain-containing protein [Synergistales bacterium]
MHRDLTAVAEDDLVLDAVRILYMQRLSGLPVVRNDWILVGFLSESDILRFALPTYLEILAQKGFLDNSEGNLIERLGRLGHKSVGEFM